MDQRRHRCRARHRVGEPDIERNLRALARTPEKHEQANRRDECSTGAEVDRSGVHTDEIENADVREQDEHRHQEPKIPDAVDDECLLASVGVCLVVEPEADEQIRTESYAFPADEQDRIVRAHYQYEHEEHKQVEVREIPRITGIVAHVADAEDMDERADSRDY